MSNNSDMIRMLRLVEGQQFAGEPQQRAGDQVRGTERAKKNGHQHPFHNRLVGEEISLEDKLAKKYQDMKDLHGREVSEMDKSQTPPGRDSGPREGPEKIAKTITKGKMVKHALDTLSKSMAKKDDKKKDVSEGSNRVDSIVTDAVKFMKGSTVSDAVLALKRVLGDRAYNERRGFYSFYVDQILDMYNQQGLSEGSGQQLTVQQLATISDEALDNAYHYGRSTPGNTFGWQANLKSAAYAKQMIDKGVTDIEAISDAIHKGWNVTAQAFVSNPEQFADTEKLRAAGKLEAKLAQREKLMNIDYAQLPDDEQEKDRVVARALLQAITGGSEQAVAEGNMPQSVIKSKQKYADMTDQEFHAAHKNKSAEELQAMAQRHGYGKGSNHYVAKHKKGSTVTEGQEEIEYICSGCSGSGEGPHEGTTCRTCHGSGVEMGYADEPDHDQEELDESQQESPMERPVMHRIMMRHMDLIEKYGLDRVLDAVHSVVDDMHYGPDDEIGTSDVSAAMNNVMNELKSQTLDEYGSLPGTSAEPVAGTTAPSSGASTPSSTPADEPASGGSANNTTLSSPAAAGVSAGGSSPTTPSAGGAAKPGAAAAAQPNVPDVPITPDEKMALDRIRANAGLKTQFDNLLKQVQPKVQ